MIDAPYKALLIKKTETQLLTHAGDAITSSQYFLLVDRNPEKQVVLLAFLDSVSREMVIVGASKTSTGNPKRRGFYETPVGVFKNAPANMSYRALGTKNDKGWRGLGAKGSRVWDLGWQTTVRQDGSPIEIRLLVHATDPNFGEPRLGKRDSKGCVRISATLNRFLDHYSILDALYEGNGKAQYVLPKNRESQGFGGSLVVVVDSSAS